MCVCVCVCVACGYNNSLKAKRVFVKLGGGEFYEKMSAYFQFQFTYMPFCRIGCAVLSGLGRYLSTSLSDFGLPAVLLLPFLEAALSVFITSCDSGFSRTAMLDVL